MTLLISEIGEEEPEPHSLTSSLHFQICVVLNVSILISYSIHIVNQLWSMQAFDGEVQFLCVLHTDEVLCHS